MEVCNNIVDFPMFVLDDARAGGGSEDECLAVGHGFAECGAGGQGGATVHAGTCRVMESLYDEPGGGCQPEIAHFLCSYTCIFPSFFRVFLALSRILE